MFFLAKCTFAILIVCVALEWRIGGASPTGAARETPTAHAKAKPAANPALAGESASSGASVMRAGAEALGRAAREKCAASPRDCLALARRLQAQSDRRLP